MPSTQQPLGPSHRPSGAKSNRGRVGGTPRLAPCSFKKARRDTIVIATFNSTFTTYAWSVRSHRSPRRPEWQSRRPISSHNHTKPQNCLEGAETSHAGISFLQLRLKCLTHPDIRPEKLFQTTESGLRGESIWSSPCW